MPQIKKALTAHAQANIASRIAYDTPARNEGAEARRDWGASDDVPADLVAAIEKYAGKGLSNDPRDFQASDDDVDPLHGLAFDRRYSSSSSSRC